MITVLSENNPTARKEHRCNFCGEKISVGEKYHTSSCVYDGQCYTWKSHLSCNEIAHELDMYNNCDDGVDEDSFCEYINNEYFTLIGESDDDGGNTFSERLKYVCDYYLTNPKTREPKQ